MAGSSISNGKPAADAKVFVVSIGTSRVGEGMWCTMPPSALPFWPKPATTDREGRFTLRGVDRSQVLNVMVCDDHFASYRFFLGKVGRKEVHATVTPSGEVILTPPPARIFEGRITYEDTHGPVAKARVEIGAFSDESSGGAIMPVAGRSDAAGRFRLNPYSGKIFNISVYPPDGEPYLIYQKQIKLEDAVQPQKIEIALPRGMLLRGKITEKSSGEPLAGASIKYEEQSAIPYRPDRMPPQNVGRDVCGLSRADGTYQIAVPPGIGTVIVQGPNNDYIRQTISSWDFKTNATSSGRLRAERLYVGAYAFLDLKPNQKPPELNLAIRRGVAIQGTIVGPHNQPVDDVVILSRHFINYNADTVRSAGVPICVKNGQFSLHGLDPDASVPFYFVDLKNETGATVEISGRSADNGPIVVHMQPCGKAIARFVSLEGRPIANHYPFLMILVSPGPSQVGYKQSNRELLADAMFVANFDHVHYWTGWNKPLLTDDEGRCTFSALIPGATYRLNVSNQSEFKDFTVKSGETLQLPDTVIREPGAMAPADVRAQVKGVVPPPKDVRIQVNQKPVATDGKSPPSQTRAITKPANKKGQSGAALSGKATDQGGGKFHLARGNTTWIGSDGAPLRYDDYDKNCYAIWGAHTVVLPKHAEGFWDFYGQRTLDPAIGRMDVSRDDWKSGRLQMSYSPGLSICRRISCCCNRPYNAALNLSEEQRTKLQDISAKYWPERRQIAGKELADTESAKQKELAVESAKAQSRACLVRRRREPFAFFQRGSREIGAAMEQRPQTDRRRAHARAVADPQGLDLPHIRFRQRRNV